MNFERKSQKSLSTESPASGLNSEMWIQNIYEEAGYYNLKLAKDCAL